MDEELERMIIRLIGDGSSYSKMLKSAVAETNFAAKAVQGAGKRIEGIRQNLDNVGKTIKEIGSNTRQAGRALSVGVTAPLVALGTVAVREFGNFDQAMTETFAKMGRQTPETTRKMTDLAKSLSMGGEVAFNPTQLAKGYEELASAGLDAVNSMNALPTTAKFAQAGAFGLDVAVKNLTGSMASYGITTQNTSPEKFAQEMVRFSDVIVGVANETTTSVEGAARAMSADAAIAAKEYGMELETLGGILGVYAMQNKDAEEAGNLTGRAVRLMTASFLKQKPVWQEMGIDLIDKSTGQWVHFADAIEQIEKSMEGLTGPQRAARLEMMGFETLAQKSILPLIGQSKEIRRQQDLYRKHGTTTEMAAIQMTSFWNSIAPTTNALRVLAIEMGEALAPSLLTLSEYVRKGVDAWRQLTPEAKQVATIVMVIAAGIGPLLLGFGLMVSLLGSAASGFAILLLPMTKMLGVGLGLGARLLGMGRSAMTGFGMLGSAAVKAATGSIPQITKSFEGSQAALARFKATSSGVFSGLVNAPKNLMMGWRGQRTAVRGEGGRFTGQYEQSQVRDFGQSARVMWAQVSGYANTASSHVQAFLRGWTSGMKATRGAGGKFVQEQLVLTRRFGMESKYWVSRPAAYLASMKLADPWAGIVYAAKYDAAKVGGYFKMAGGIAASGMVAAMRGAGSAAAAGLRMSFSAAFIGIRAGARITGSALRSMGGGIMRMIDWIGTLASTAGSFAGPFAAMAGTIATVTMVAGPAFGIIAAVISGLLSPIGLIVAGIAAIGAGIAYFSGFDLSSMWTKGSEGVSRFVGFVKGFVANFRVNMAILLDWISTRWNAVWGGLSGIVSSTIETVKQTIVGLFPSMTGLWENVTTGAAEAWGGALEYVRGFFSFALGFVSNFSENMTLLWGFLRENWRAVLSDVLGFIVTFASNMGQNIMVGVTILFRMWSAFGGWLVSMFKKLFSFQVVDAVLSGLIIIGTKVREWASAAWQVIKDTFTGKKSGAMDTFINKANEDIKKGGGNVNLIETFADIMKEEASGKGMTEGFKNPLADVQMKSLQNMPKFNLAVEGVELPQFVLDQSKQAAGAATEAGAQIGADIQSGAGKGLSEEDKIRPAIAHEMKPMMPVTKSPAASTKPPDAHLEMIAKGIARLVEIEEQKENTEPVVLQRGGIRK